MQLWKSVPKRPRFSTPNLQPKFYQRNESKLFRTNFILETVSTRRKKFFVENKCFEILSMSEQRLETICEHEEYAELWIGYVTGFLWKKTCRQYLQLFRNLRCKRMPTASSLFDWNWWWNMPLHVRQTSKVKNSSKIILSKRHFSDAIFVKMLGGLPPAWTLKRLTRE